MSGLVIMIKGLMTKRVGINVDKKIAEVMDKILEYENESFYMSKGCKMSRNDLFFWLTLQQNF